MEHLQSGKIMLKSNIAIGAKAKCMEKQKSQVELAVKTETSTFYVTWFIKSPVDVSLSTYK